LLLSIESHLSDYEAKLKAAKRSGGHVSKTLYCIRQAVAFAGFKLAGDIAAGGVNRYAADRRAKGDASRTVQAHLAAIKGFTKWLVETDKLPRDPLASIKRPNPKADRRYERRMLLPDEWKWLRATVKANSFGMSGAQRLLLYETAIQTGLRSAELRSLTRARLFLDGERPYVTCKASDTKNDKEARQYVRPELAAALGQHVATRKPQAAIFTLPEEWKMAKMLRADLVTARQAWIDEAKGDAKEHKRRDESDFLAETNHEGCRLDFHALRHTCGAWLAMSGVHPKVGQTVMRHSTIVLTMDTYGHLFPGQEAEAVGKLGLLLGCVDKAASAARGSARGSAQDDKSGDVERHSETLCDSDDAAKPSANSFSEKTLCEVVRRDETPKQSRAARTRTGNQRIMSSWTPLHNAT
jgi:integrase